MPYTPEPLKVGDRVQAWWGGNTTVLVLAILPYKGSFKQHFNCVLRLEAGKTARGWIEMAYLDPGRAAPKLRN